MVDIPIQIINGTKEIIISTTDSVSSFWLPLFLVAVTSIIAIITFYYNRKLYDENKQSNELLRTELKAKLKPLLRFTKSSTNLIKENENYKIEFHVIMQNIGEVPMRKIRLIDWKSKNKEICHLVKEKKTNTYLSVDTLQQGANHEFMFPIHWDKDESEAFYVLWFEYVFLKTEERIVAVFKITAGRENLEHSWFVEDDILEAEKEWQDEKSGKKFAPT